MTSATDAWSLANKNIGPDLDTLEDIHGATFDLITTATSQVFDTQKYRSGFFSFTLSNPSAVAGTFFLEVSPDGTTFFVLSREDGRACQGTSATGISI